MKNRKISLDVIRCIAIWMIVFFHFCCAYSKFGSFFCVFQNGTWGCVGTTMFFILSGYLMRQCNSNITSVVNFYKKRALSLYPLLIITFLGAYIIQSILVSNFMYGGHPWKIILSLLGIDGYLGFYSVQTYYVVGEWFTAMIIMLYLLFPWLNILFEKFLLLGTIIFTGLYYGNIFVGIQNIVADASVFTAILLFWIGMIIQKHTNKLEKNTILFAILLILSIIIVFVKLPINTLICQNVLGISIFLIMLFMFKNLNKITSDKWYIKPIVFISESSFAVYLSHHFIIKKVLGLFSNLENIKPKIGINLVITILVILIVSTVLYYIDIFLRSKSKDLLLNLKFTKID